MTWHSTWPIEELTGDTDCFGTLEKAKAIKETLNRIFVNHTPCRMMALYGEWGCGKTSVLKWLKSEYEGSNTLVLFFEAWHYEKDDNLALSLLDFITEEVDYREKGRILKTGVSLLKNTARSLSFGVPGAGIDGSKLIDGVEQDFAPRMSYHRQLQQMKAEFGKLEEYILASKGVDNILIMVDDLDRCEPDKIVDLISSIKLFFTYTPNIHYLCAIDEEAVQHALKVKYAQSEYFAEHYLEKLFDTTFHMPKWLKPRTLIRKMCLGLEEFETKILSDFFVSLGFTNPRKIVHLLNKLKLISPYSECNSVVQYYFHIYWAILLEYYPETMEEITDYHKWTDLLETAMSKDSSSQYTYVAPKDTKIESLFSELSYLATNEDAKLRYHSQHILLMLPRPFRPIECVVNFNCFLLHFRDLPCKIPYNFVNFLWQMNPGIIDRYQNKTDLSVSYEEIYMKIASKH